MERPKRHPAPVAQIPDAIAGIAIFGLQWGSVGLCSDKPWTQFYPFYPFDLRKEANSLNVMDVCKVFSGVAILQSLPSG